MPEAKLHRHLLVGALPPPVGGTTVLFHQLVSALTEHPLVHVTAIDTAVRRKGRASRLAVAARVLWKCLCGIPRHDSVALHASVDGLYFFAPALFVLSRLFRRPFIVRAFGGDLDLRYKSASRYGRFVFRTSVLKSELLLVETCRLLDRFATLTKQRVEWYPNSRPIPNEVPHTPRGAKLASRFVFLGHVKEEKGVYDLVSAFKQLDDTSHLYIYGPILGEVDPSELQGSNITYCGSIAPSEVTKMLSTMDVLVLPTRYQGEGHPGVILEAYAAGLPVITTNFRSIPEIVNSHSGILVEPGRVDQLADALRFFTINSAAFTRAKEAATDMAGKFASSKWNKRYAGYLQTLSYRQR